jgi:hypothetical protein
MKNIPCISMSGPGFRCSPNMNLGSQGSGISSSMNKPINTNVPNTGNSYPSNNQDYGNDKEYGGNSSDNKSFGNNSGNGFSSSENYLFSRIDQSTNSMVKQLKNGEWSLGINTASFSGRASKNNDGISNQVKGCFDWVQQKGGIDTLRLLTFRECDLTEVDMVYYCNQMAGYSVRFEYLDFSYNRINDSGIRCLFKHSFIPTGTYAKHIVNLNLSKNNIGDDSAKIISQALVDGKMPATKSIDVSGNKISDKGAGTIAEALKTGKFPTLKRFDVSGNDISLVGEKFMLDALKHPSTQSVILLLKRSNDLKIAFSGSKEEKQKLVKETLQTAQDNGVDVKNVAVSKGLWEFLKNSSKLAFDFGWGFGKCNIVPEDAETFAMEAITAKISKKAIAANTAKDAVVCFFDTIDEVSTSFEGIQFIKDLDLVGASSVIDSIE